MNNAKYLVQAYINGNRYKEEQKEFINKLEAKKYIENLSKKHNHSELTFFLYSGTVSSNKQLIGYMECFFGDWRNCEFYKRGSEANNPTDLFSWKDEYPENDQEDEESI